MFTHLGMQVSIPDKDIILIMSIKSLDKSKLTSEFLHSRKILNQVVQIGEGQPKSIVITSDTIYLSPVSVSTLYRRYKIDY
ncbi:MAG: DUF370 domain-containing protein [Firmicutes bacterium]|jgi:hypothetical protein|nr:DUF370 domain-containing protein [Bacillota bacterium]